MFLTALSLLACEPTDTDTTDTSAGDTADSAVVIDTTPVWKQYRNETSSTFNGLYASGAGVYLVGTGGFAWTGGTDGWTFMEFDVDDADVTDLWGQGQNESTILAASTTIGKVAQYSGGVWNTGTLGDTSQLEAVGGSGPDALFAVGFGRAWAYNGSEWTYETIPGNPRLNDVYAEGAEAIAVGDGGDCIHRKDGTWTACDLGSTEDFTGISGSSMNDVWAVGAGGVVSHYDGTSWELVEQTVAAETLWAVFVPDPGVVFAVGNNGIALRRGVGGEWEQLHTGVDNHLYSVHGVSSKNVWAGGNRGMVLQYKSE